MKCTTRNAFGHFRRAAWLAAGKGVWYNLAMVKSLHSGYASTRVRWRLGWRWADGAANPTAVRYNWGMQGFGNLYNAAGLPASCFTTEP